ncbi:hypothetical protein [Thiobacter aerophilum]|uniref:Uncharacterized protein n=1 Tax=Thiobacter aerophilum TaxID=3121275 RepID=A0ABV0EEV3_9BURK
MNTKRKLLVLARRDHAEAMRVAAGLTIFGHQVRLVFMDRLVAETEENAAMAELLALSDIAPETTVAEQTDLAYLDAAALGAAIAEADGVLSL